MKLIQEMDRSTRVEKDPVKQAIAEMGLDDPHGDRGAYDAEVVDRIAAYYTQLSPSEWKEQMGNIDEDTMREHIGMELENVPGYDYESGSADHMIDAIMDKIRKARHDLK